MIPEEYDFTELTTVQREYIENSVNLAVVEESNLNESLQPNAGEDGASMINNDEDSIS